MSVVAYTELLIFVRVLLGTITFQNSFISPIIYAHFLRQRYYQSPFTRHALAQADAQIAALVARPGIPPVVGQIWEKVRGLVGTWAGSTLQQNPAAAPAAGRR